jgi:hypothetical protein
VVNNEAHDGVIPSEPADNGYMRTHPDDAHWRWIETVGKPAVIRLREVEAALEAAEFDVLRLRSSLSCIRVALGIGEAVTEVKDALIIPAEVIHAWHTHSVLKPTQHKPKETK